MKQRRETIIGAIGGIAVGYLLWLVAISLGGDNATVGQWGPLVLLLAVALAIGAAVWGWRLRQRREYLSAAFVFGLPILPVLLTLAMLAVAYV